MEFASGGDLFQEIVNR
jgi:5'-AMP-activated protein kinase catalytic alpha subunit